MWGSPPQAAGLLVSHFLFLCLYRVQAPLLPPHWEQLNKKMLVKTPGAAMGSRNPQTTTQIGHKGQCLPSGAASAQVTPLHKKCLVSSPLRNTLLGF